MDNIRGHVRQSLVNNVNFLQTLYADIQYTTGTKMILQNSKVTC